MGSTSLESMFGRAYSAQELADFLGLDRRTVIKYATTWGGVEVAPGTWRFFEKRIMEVLNAQQGYETGGSAVPWQCHRSGSSGTEDVRGRQQKVASSGRPMGKRNKKAP